MIAIFYSMLFAFIFAEIYHFYNRKRLDLIFKNKSLKTIRKADIAFYISKTLSIFWPAIGLMSSFYELFMLLIVINLMKFVLYHININAYKAYILLLPFANVAIYMSILFLKLFTR